MHQNQAVPLETTYRFGDTRNGRRNILFSNTTEGPDFPEQKPTLIERQQIEGFLEE